jgi:hypothetical protein
MTVDMSCTHVDYTVMPSQYKNVQYNIKQLAIKWLNEIIKSKQITGIETLRDNLKITIEQIELEDVSIFENIRDLIEKDEERVSYAEHIDKIIGLNIMKGVTQFIQYFSYRSELRGYDVYDVAIAICVLLDFKNKNNIQDEPYLLHFSGSILIVGDDPIDNNFECVLHALLSECSACDDINDAKIYFG